jgi:hypothetical protein
LATLCYLRVTDIKKHFATFDFLVKMNLVSTVVHINSTTLITRLDVLRNQPIKLFQVVSTSELHEYWWNNHLLFNIFMQGHRSLQNWLLKKLSMKSLDQKFKFHIKEWVLWCPNLNFLNPKYTTLKIHDPPKNQFSKFYLIQ